MEELRQNCALHEERLKNLENNVTKILTLLQGNGQMGFITKAGLAYDDMVLRKTQGNKLKVDIYRWIIFAILGFIAIKVGLK